jgi:folate-binding protein YgfZ
LNAASTASAVRRGAGLFRALPRAVVEVEGSDRVRWLNGMITNDVSALDTGPANSGRYAALLSPKGRIIADLQVLERGDAFWLDVDAGAVTRVLETLGRYIIADDVTLRERGAELPRLGLEGPDAIAIVRKLFPELPELAADACTEVAADGLRAVVARFGWSGEPALQLFAASGTGGALAERLLAAGEASGLVEASNEVLETLRIEAGTPRFGAELDDSVLPAEAGIERAISVAKGCYTGQEVVERMRTQGRPSHHLVGLTAAGEGAFSPGTELSADGRRVGEITSACRSEPAGAIALAFVRRAFCAPGTELDAGGTPARVTSLPFVAVEAQRPGA